jgi:hypothetical protein
MPSYDQQEQQAVVIKASGSEFFEHYWCNDIGEWIGQYGPWLQQRNEAGADVFYTTGRFSSVAAPLEQYKGRKIDNCTSHRSLFLDIDAKSQIIPTVDACYLALEKFMVEADILTPSAVIASGGGIHAYWICDEDIPLEMWQALADTLAGAAIHFGLKCDTQCTVDRCRVLRLPGYINHKYGTTTELTFEQPELTLEEICTMLTPHFELRNARPARSAKAAQTQNLFAGIDLSGAMDATLKGEGTAFGGATPSWAKLRDASAAGNGCQVIQWAMNNQSETEYGLWTGILSIARCTDNEDQAIIDTCSQHPEFDLHTCKAKAASFDGPRTCAVLEYDAKDSGCAGGCTGCPMKGKITSPLIMGYPDFRLPGENPVEIVQQTVTVHQQQPDGTVVQIQQVQEVERNALPFPYLRLPGKPGIYQKESVEDQGGKKQWVVSEYPLLEEDIGIVLVKQGGPDDVVAYYEYTHPMQGVRKFSIPTSDLVAGQGNKWPGILANNFVNMTRAAVSQTWKSQVSKFLQTLANDWSTNFKAADTVEQFGPIEGQEDTFVYGDLCYRPGMEPKHVVLAEATAAPWAAKMARPPATAAERADVAAKIERWNAGLKQTIGDTLVCGPDQFVLMTGFACPLAPFVAPARQRGGLIVPNSTEAGSGKTSMVARAIQMYVSGDEGFLVPNATKMAFLEGKVALAGALPVCWDEIMKGRDDANSKLLNELALSSTDRKPRERLTGGSITHSWQSWFYGTMNPDPHEMIGQVGSSTHGAVARVVNIKVGANRFGTGAAKLRKQQAENQFDDWSKRNANVVGQKWIQGFMDRLPHLRERFLHWSGRLVEDCPAAFDDSAMRFATTIVATTMAAAEEASIMGLHPFNVEAVYAYAVTLLGDTTEKASDAVMHDDEIIPAMLNSSLDVMLVVNQTSGLPILDRLPNKEVGIRVEVGEGDWSEVFVTVAYVKRWCAERGLSVSKYKQALNVVGTDKSSNKRMATGTNLPTAPTRAYQFKTHSSRFISAEQSAEKL